MATTFSNTTQERAPSPTLATWILPGLVAGLAFAMWAMMVGLFTSTLWAPPQGIAQSIGIGSPGHQVQTLPLFVGLMGHMMNSVILGAVFVLIARVLSLSGGRTVLAGMVYGLVVYAAMYWVILRGLLHASSASFLSANPEWSWVLAHLMFGVLLGALLAYGPWRLRAGGTN
jgi:uncharacterized membrane protein YagU involved in acid resistance